MRSLWHNGACQVARLKPMMHFLPLAMPGREASLIGATHLAIAVACGRDVQGYDPLDLERLGRTLTNTCGVTPVRLCQIACATIELGQAPATTFDWQPDPFELLK